MSTSAITFDQLESSADNTLAWVLWVKNVKNMALAAAAIALLNRIAKSLVTRLTKDNRLTSLSDEQAADLAKKLQEIHSQLEFLLGRTARSRSNVLFASSLGGIEESADDFADIIEDLIMSCNPEFRAMLVECTRAAIPSHSAELVGRM